MIKKDCFFILLRDILRNDAAYCYLSERNNSTYDSIILLFLARREDLLYAIVELSYVFLLKNNSSDHSFISFTVVGGEFY